MSATETADHTLHPRHNGVCPPCPAERAEALGLVKRLEAALAAFDAAAVTLASAAEDADVLELWEASTRRDTASAPEVITGFLQSCRDTALLIDAEKLEALRKLAGAA